MKKDRRTVAEHLAAQLSDWGVRFVFGDAGKNIRPMVSAILRNGGLRYIETKHPENAALMASAYAKLSGHLGVCLSESGPAALRMLNGLYDARKDRVPILALVGYSPTDQLAVKQPRLIDDVISFHDATTAIHMLFDEHSAIGLLNLSIRSALHEKGPTLMGLPFDLQTKTIEASLRRWGSYLGVSPSASQREIKKAARLLMEAKRPVIFVGRGTKQYIDDVLLLAEKVKAGIVHSLLAVGRIPYDHPLNLGVSGKLGTEASEDVFGRADLALVIGSTWHQREFMPVSARIIQIDNDVSHIGMLYRVDLALPGDGKKTIPRLNEMVSSVDKPEWENFIHRTKEKWTKKIDRLAVADHVPIRPQRVIRALGETLAPDAILAVDTGDHTFWFGQQFRARKNQVIISGHWRVMGAAIPAAIAARLDNPDRQVLCLIGDGCFGISGMEIATALRYDLPFTMVVMNNGGMSIEKHSEFAHGNPEFGTEIHNPNFADLGEAWGGLGFKVTQPNDLEPALRDALNSKKLAIIDVEVAEVLPKPPKVMPRMMADTAIGLTRQYLHI